MTEILQQFPQYAWAALSVGLVAIIFRLIGVVSTLAQTIARQQTAAAPVPLPVPVSPPAQPAPPQPPPKPAPAPTPAPPPAPSGPFAAAPPWFQAALHEIGFHETGANQGIERYIQMGHCGAPGDPWCAIFANAMLESVGIPGTRSASSQSFRRHHPAFVPLDGPALGAIAVFGRGTRNDDPDIGHVGFYRGSSPGRVWTLGGNEDDMVELAPLIENGSSFWLIGYYWPASVARPAIGPINIPMGAPVRTPPAGGVPAAPVASGEWITGITATMFGGADDPNTSAYDGHMITDSEIGCALSFHYPKPLPLVEARNPRTGATLQMSPVDVGPWNTKDDWLRAGARPLAEAQYASGTKAQNGRVPTNDAGIDLTPAAATRLGIEGKGKVDVRLITATGQSPTVT